MLVLVMVNVLDMVYDGGIAQDEVDVGGDSGDLLIVHMGHIAPFDDRW